MHQFIKSFEKDDDQFDEFQSNYRKYLQLKEKINSDIENPKIANLVSKTLTKSVFSISKNVPGLNVVTEGIKEYIGEEELLSHAGEWGEFIYKKIKDKDERLLLLNPEEVLISIFLDCLNKLDQNRITVLFFDTFEYLKQFIEQWLIDIFDEKYGFVSTNIVFVISGRDEINNNLWDDNFPIMNIYSLIPFSEEETKEYLTNVGITNDEVINVIIQISDNLPILVSTIASENQIHWQILVTNQALLLKDYFGGLKLMKIKTLSFKQLFLDILMKIVVTLGIGDIAKSFSWIQNSHLFLNK